MKGKRFLQVSFMGFSFIALQSCLPKIRQRDNRTKLFKTLESKRYEESRKKEAALCAVAKNEEFYLEEWIDYNLFVVGFDHVFLFDNSEDFDLKGYFLSPRHQDRLTVIHYPGKSMQSNAYMECSRDFAAKYTYAAFFDTDEFLVLKKSNNVGEFLREYIDLRGRKVGAVSVSWLIMRSSGYRIYRPSPVSFRFRHHDGELNQHIKSICRINSMKKIPFHVHFCSMKARRIRVNTAGHKLTEWFDDNPQDDIAVLYHYMSKSHKEYILKRMRGRADCGDCKIKELLQQAKAGAGVTNGTVYDDTVWQKLIQARPQYRMFENYAVPAVPRYEPQSFNRSSSSSPSTVRIAVLCATTQNEEAYIDEWVDYHLALGFTKIVLYDTTETFELQQWGAEKHDKVQVYPFYNHTEEEALDHCRQRALYVDNREQAGGGTSSSSSSSWLAYWEVGSMLILRQHKNVLDFLAQREIRSSSSRIVIKRQVFQVSDQELYRPRPFTYRFRYVSTIVDEDHVRIMELRQATKNDTSTKSSSSSSSSSSSKSPSVIPVAPTNEAVLFAYPLRAAKEYVKRFGGSTDNVTLFSGSFLLTEVENHVTYTDEGWEMLKQYVPWYAEYEKL